MSTDQDIEDERAAALAERSAPAPGLADNELADEWGAALAEQGASSSTTTMGAEWATMIDQRWQDLPRHR